MANMLTARNQPWTLVAVSNDPLLAARCERRACPLPNGEGHVERGQLLDLATGHRGHLGGGVQDLGGGVGVKVGAG